jgi:hypothetical protein
MDRLDVPLNQMHARLDRTGATLDRIQGGRDTLIKTRQLLWWWILLTLEITSWTLLMTGWR